jgi:hypothetical protein
METIADALMAFNKASLPPPPALRVEDNSTQERLD